MEWHTCDLCENVLQTEYYALGMMKIYNEAFIKPQKQRNPYELSHNPYTPPKDIVERKEICEECKLLMDKLFEIKRKNNSKKILDTMIKELEKE